MTMHKTAAFVASFLLTASLCIAAGYYRELLALPRVAGGAAEDLHWFDPYSTNAIGTAFLLDWPTNTVAARGSIGSGWDAGATNGAATAGVLSNQVSVVAGPARQIIGTNILGDVNYGWNFVANASNAISINDKDNYTLSSGTNDIPHTFYVWVLPSEAISGNVISKNTYNNREYDITRTVAGVLTFRRYSANDKNIACSTASPVLTSNVWVHVTAVCDGGTNGYAIYTNAAASSTTVSYSGNYDYMKNGSSPLVLGFSGGLKFSGSIAYFGIIRTNLTPSEVTNLFNGFGGSAGPGAAIRKRIPVGAYP